MKPSIPVAPAAMLLLVAALNMPAAESASSPIDRRALVTRHNPVVRSVDVDAPLTVGNGGFAFTCDITGLQTFAEHYHRWGVPTETLARWCWVSDENTNNYTLADASRDFVQADGRTVAYPTRQSSPAGDWLRKNPRIHPLGQLAFEYTKADGTPLAPEDIQEPEQTLDLWTGIITSKFKIEGVPVEVRTACDSDADAVAVRVESDLVANGKLKVSLVFPRGHDLNVKNTPGLDWSQPEAHESKLNRTTFHGRMMHNAAASAKRPDDTRPASVFVLETVTAYMVERRVSSTNYRVVTLSPLKQVAAHRFEIQPEKPGHRTHEFFLAFTPVEPRDVGDAPLMFARSRHHWSEFWRTTAAVDFSGSTNPLAPKLEERIILSRYLMAVQMAGDVPPQESGLTCATWYGKHHTEMIWWHAAHFALWGQDAALARNLDWYYDQLDAARALAASRGLKGARWAKMTGPEMRESPGGNPLIVWNQPHMIYLCELLRRNQPDDDDLVAKYRDLVFETADCLATMVHFDEAKGHYVLGPPLWIAQEIYDQATSQNPSFELAYWRWALEVAQQWRERLREPRDPKWDHVINHLAPIPQKDGKYVALGSHPDTWDNIDSRHDHPTMLAPLGVLPGGPDVDRATMERTLDAVLATWDWETKIWGWDYPMIAMTAARLGRPETAVEILLRDGPNNRYLPNGHCPQRSDEKMPANPPPGARKREIAVYLPANGSFLAAVALMVAGWDGNTEEFPGFAKDGSWTIRAEGLHRLP